MRDTIDMAREAGFNFTGIRDIWCDSTVVLKAFEALVRADERNSWPAEMEAMERQVNILTDALAAEREVCAKFVDHILKEGGGTWGDAIRNRGNT
jgi:hypothetical protein